MSVLKGGQVFCKNAPQGSQENLLRRISLEDLIVLNKKFCFLVTVGACPGWEAAFSDVIRFQCNCLVFWSRCACECALLLGLHLKIDDGGIACAATVSQCPFASLTVCSVNLFGQVSFLLTINTCRTIITDDVDDGLKKRQRLKSGPRQEAQLAPHE